MTSLATEKAEELKRVEKFPELSFFSFYIGLNTGKSIKNKKLYDRCKDLINGEYNNPKYPNIKKNINRVASKGADDDESKVLLNHLTNVLYASIGLGIKKQACKECSKKGGRKKQSGGAWNENGEWEGEEGEPTPNDYAMATYDNVMTMVTNVQNSQAVQLANRYLDELPVILEVDEDDSTFVRTGKQGINSTPYIFFSYHLLTLCVYASYLIRILNKDLLGVEEANTVYEFKKTPALMELTDGKSDDKVGSQVMIYDAHEVWTDEVYPSTDLIPKIQTIDVILNRGTARDDMKLYLTVAGEMAVERIKDQVVEKSLEGVKDTVANAKKHAEQIQERRDATYDMTNWMERMRYNMDEYARFINLWEPVDDYTIGLSRSIAEQQMNLEYEAKKMAFDIKNQIEDTLKIHSKNTLRAANQVFWSGLVVFGTLGALAMWACYKKMFRRGGNIRLRPRRAVRQISDSQARNQGIHDLVFEFDGDQQRWVPISGLRSGNEYLSEQQIDQEFLELEHEEPRYGCPSLAWVSGCNIMGGKRKKKRKTRRKKRRKTRRKSKKRKSKRRRRKRKKTRRKRR